MLKGSMLVVVADGAVGRFLSRSRPGARLVEQVDMRLAIAPSAPERDHAPRTHDRYGRSGHTLSHRQTAHEAAEETFLASVVDRTASILDADATTSLVLCAPPKALGIMRKLLPTNARERLVLSLDRDLTKETPAELGARFKDIGPERGLHSS